MATKRRQLALASVLAVDHIVLSIVQCFHSPQDVVAFLRAMAAPLLSAPLTALLALLSTSSPTVLRHWPAIILEKVDAPYVDLALDALPALPAIRIASYEALERALSGRFQDLAAFTAAWKRAEGGISSAEQILVFEKHNTLLNDAEADGEP